MKIAGAVTMALLVGAATAGSAAPTPPASPSPAAAAQASPTPRSPSIAARPYVVLEAQSLADLQKRLQSDNKAEDLIGGAGMQLRVAVQHEKDKADAAAELHDASDDVYYILEGSALLTLGGRLDAPQEAQPGEWRAARILEGRTVEVHKGDLVIVPRGTPHQRSTAGRDFSMILIKIFAQPLPPETHKP